MIRMKPLLEGWNIPQTQATVGMTLCSVVHTLHWTTRMEHELATCSENPIFFICLVFYYLYLSTLTIFPLQYMFTMWRQNIYWIGNSEKRVDSAVLAALFFVMLNYLVYGQKAPPFLCRKRDKNHPFIWDGLKMREKMFNSYYMKYNARKKLYKTKYLYIKLTMKKPFNCNQSQPLMKVMVFKDHSDDEYHRVPEERTSLLCWRSKK